jgi:outer membrane protein
VREAKSNYYPEFFVKLGLDYLENSKVREQAIMSATVGFKVNLFDGLATTSRLRQAVEQRSRDRERLRDLEERVRLELATAQNDLQVASARIKVAEQAIRQGVENLRINKDRYQEKVGTATDVIDAQTLLTQTRTDYYQSVFDLELASARVKRALGQL